MSRLILSGPGGRRTKTFICSPLITRPSNGPYGSDCNGRRKRQFVVSPFFIVELQQLGAHFHVTAVGASPRCRRTFTLPMRLVSLLPRLPSAAQTGTLTYGTAGNPTYLVTVNRSSNGAGTAPLSITGLPTGVTGTFSPASVSFTGNNSSATSTLTVSHNYHDAGRQSDLHGHGLRIATIPQIL